MKRSNLNKKFWHKRRQYALKFSLPKLERPVIKNSERTWEVAVSQLNDTARLSASHAYSCERSITIRCRKGTKKNPWNSFTKESENSSTLHVDWRHSAERLKRTNMHNCVVCLTYWNKLFARVWGIISN